MVSQILVEVFCLMKKNLPEWCLFQWKISFKVVEKWMGFELVSPPGDYPKWIGTVALS